MRDTTTMYAAYQFINLSDQWTRNPPPNVKLAKYNFSVHITAEQPHQDDEVMIGHEIG